MNSRELRPVMSVRSIDAADRRKIGLAFAAVLFIGVPLASAKAQDAHAESATAEKPFLAENDAAMDKMMRGMTVNPSGDVDHDFVAMMVPHHQGAVDMAQAELRYGHNEQLRRIAQEIIVDQLQEIAAMRLALGQPLPPSSASPTQPSPVSGTEEDRASAMSHAMTMH